MKDEKKRDHEAKGKGKIMTEESKDRREIATHLIPGQKGDVLVLCLDEPGEGGACHEYLMVPSGGGLASKVHFQNGPVQEAGFNGTSHEAMLAILIDRMEHFQRGDFACCENGLALTKMQEALHWLQHRTIGRLARGVEGTHEK